jgi:hypothetical protein
LVITPVSRPRPGTLCYKLQAGVQESQEQITPIGVAFNTGCARTDLAVYIPLLAAGLIGYGGGRHGRDVQRIEWGLVCLTAAVGMTLSSTPLTKFSDRSKLRILLTDRSQLPSRKSKRVMPDGPPAISSLVGSLTRSPNDRLLAILDSIAPDQKRVQVAKWHQLLGELHSIRIGIPGAKGLLQAALRHQTNNRVRLSPAVHASLDDFRWIAQDLTSRPTRLAEILSQDPTAVGAVDAAGAGERSVVCGIRDATSATIPPAL